MQIDESKANSGLPWWLCGKESACQCRRRRFNPWVGKIPWRRNWQSTLVFLPGKLHGQRSLVGYSPWGCKELDTTERLNNNKANSSVNLQVPTYHPALTMLTFCQSYFIYVPLDIFWCGGWGLGVSWVDILNHILRLSRSVVSGSVRPHGL